MRRGDPATDMASIEEINARQWEDFTLRHPQASLYHLPDWHEVIDQAYGRPARYLALKGPDGQIRAGLPYAAVGNPLLGGRRLVAYPYSDHCDPLIDAPEQLPPLLAAFQERAREHGTDRLEIRGWRCSAIDSAPEPESGYCNFSLELDEEPDALFKRFHPSCVQRAVRKAERSQVEAIEGDSLEDLQKFYRLHVRTRKRLGAPVQPWRFFDLLWRRMRPSNRLTLLLARCQGRTAAAMVLLRFRQTLYYKFGASDPRWLRLRPNHLLFWNAIRMAAESGCRSFELGRTAVGNRGLMQFKSRWAASRTPLRYFTKPDGSAAFEKLEGGRTAALASAAIRRMPPSVLRGLSGMIYRYLG